MIYTTRRGRLGWSWWKNAPDLRGLVGRSHPRFVLHDVESLGGVIPVFTYHSVEPVSFERDCRALVEGRYHTLGADEFLAVVDGHLEPPPRSVLLTFDDGTGSLRSVAWPLLDRHGLRGTAFVVAGLVPDDVGEEPTLHDVWDGRAPLERVLDRETRAPLCSWKELREMRASGVISVQSHSSVHALVHVGPRVRDFINPATVPYLFGNVNVPMVREDGRDRVDRPLVLGRPIYECRPLLEGRPRFFDDPGVREACEVHVAAAGGEVFFGRRRWRSELARVARRARRARPLDEGFQSEDALREAIERDLGEARERISAEVGPVEHLCYPWYTGSDLAVSVSRRLGYRTGFWGVMPGSNEVRPGSPLARLPRVDARYLPRLPGPGRRPLRDIVGDHYLSALRRRPVATREG